MSIVKLLLTFQFLLGSKFTLLFVGDEEYSEVQILRIPLYMHICTCIYNLRWCTRLSIVMEFKFFKSFDSCVIHVYTGELF